jgi:uncharacterized membrane-anchored protein
MSVHFFGLSFGTGQIIIGVFIAVIVIMYFMQKSR